jgi:hypothetical protein
MLRISSAFNFCPLRKSSGSQLVAIDGCDGLEREWQVGFGHLTSLFMFAKISPLSCLSVLVDVIPLARGLERQDVI